ncbi:glycosyltransferase [Rhodococcus opacus]|nr:glycosyltransferase [Rhodococcus opacus]
MNWVDDRFQKVAQVQTANEFLVTVVGNCSHIKNHGPVVSAVRRLTDCSLAHLGDEGDIGIPESCMLDSLSKSSQLAARGVRDPLEILKITSVFCMPSKNEGMGIALAEAICAGVPCLISDAPGLSWAKIFDGVETVSSENGWCDAIAQTRAKYGSGKRFVRDVSLLSAENGVRDYLSLYRGDV